MSETLVTLSGTKDQAPAITLTDSATAKVAELLAHESDDSLALRVAVRPGGCSGYSYEMFFDSDIAHDDERTTWGTIDVVVDQASAGLIRGAQLDFQDGLAASGFSISNPNAQRSCGCGQSFS